MPDFRRGAVRRGRGDVLACRRSSQGRFHRGRHSHEGLRLTRIRSEGRGSNRAQRRLARLGRSLALPGIVAVPGQAQPTLSPLGLRPTPCCRRSWLRGVVAGAAARLAPLPRLSASLRRGSARASGLELSWRTGGGEAVTAGCSASKATAPTRNRMSWIVVAGAPDRNAASSAGLRNAASSSRSVEWATVTFSTPRRTSPNRVWQQFGSPTAAFQASSNSCRARSRP